MEENCDETKTVGSNPEDIIQTSNAEQSCQLWEVKIACDFENSEQPFQNVPIYIDYLGESSGTSLNINAVTGTWAVRPKLLEKSTTSEPEGVVSEGSGETERRGRKRKQSERGSVNEFLRTKSHLRYLLHRIKYEQNLIDAYSSEGWKGQSLEKLKPEKELHHARSHILRYKLKIRDLFQCIDQSLAEGKLPECLFDFKGEINSEDIFCAKCGSKELTVDNDIILCDGACQRGFHQFCLEPPLLKEHIPPDDEGWLCPGCDCKVDCIHMLNNFQETKVSIFDNWEKIFPDAAAAVTSGKNLDDGCGSSSRDNENKNYYPDKPDELVKIFGGGSSSDESHFLPTSEDLVAPVDNKYYQIPSDDSEDDDFDPSAPDKDEPVMQECSSSGFTSDSEDLGGLLDDANVPGLNSGNILAAPFHEWPCTGSGKEKSKVDRMKRESLKDDLSYLLETCDEPSSSKRHAKRLDYKKLHDETYGNSSDSSDEDFEHTTAHKRRNMRSTSVTKNKRDMEKESGHLPPRTQERLVDGSAKNSSGSVDFAGPKNRRSAYRCLDKAETQILFESFKENQYPERAVKENLAKELGLTIQQVSNWFNNTRWRFHHRSQTLPYSTESASGNCNYFQDKAKPNEPEMPSVTEASSVGVVVWHESNPTAGRDHITQTRVENQ